MTFSALFAPLLSIKWEHLRQSYVCHKIEAPASLWFLFKLRTGTRRKQLSNPPPCSSSISCLIHNQTKNVEASLYLIQVWNGTSMSRWSFIQLQNGKLITYSGVELWHVALFSGNTQHWYREGSPCKKDCREEKAVNMSLLTEGPTKLVLPDVNWLWQQPTISWINDCTPHFVVGAVRGNTSQQLKSPGTWWRQNT